ncbi:MAG: hypothetical protein GEU28_13635 [Dehalococcoidia bacterium]|nr:hypothetical protein [Dehalococcoidia bacterium]
MGRPGSTAEARPELTLAIAPGGEDEARAFYCGALGLREVGDDSGDILLETDSDRLRIRLHAGEPEGARRQRLSLLAPEGSFLQQRALSGAFQRNKRHDFLGYTRCFTNDPWGNLVEIFAVL